MKPVLLLSQQRRDLWTPIPRFSEETQVNAQLDGFVLVAVGIKDECPGVLSGRSEIPSHNVGRRAGIKGRKTIRVSKSLLTFAFFAKLWPKRGFHRKRLTQLFCCLCFANNKRLAGPSTRFRQRDKEMKTKITVTHVGLLHCIS